MDAQKAGARSGRASSVDNTYGSLMLKAAGVLRLRYVQCSQDTSLSPADAEELAEVFERIAEGDPAFDQIDPKEAIALAHRLLDDDHPELSILWPAGG
ncbi:MULTISPECIES: hypothetical protein [Amycolatopsis methanolica group]|uniref:Uncharacterized protein n=2 Tax=Amycolatopsis methanolica group TaxID=2893674 RepID=A0A076N0M7_AMYME|nr:hypothetical protein [Amycolatopsis methanolica]AIJ24631.1 hypothetical protein AMETH_4539 [Amycolatopsis methanolica 239]